MMRNESGNGTTRLVAADFETIEILPDGSTVASTEAYRPNFRVSSCAFTWEESGVLVSKYTEGEDETREYLQLLSKENARLIWHNYTYDGLVAKCRFPDIPLNHHADTMRLAQVFDNGGGANDFTLIEEEDILEPGDKPKMKRLPTEGLGLVKCVQRILGDSTDHKKEAYDWLMKETGCKPKQCGSLLHLLPRDIMERYNCADTESTYRLYKYITDHFRFIQYDWTFDHSLYMMSANRIIDGKISGIAVDRVALQAYKSKVEQEIEDIGADFRRTFLEQIEQIEKDRLTAWASAPKTDKGKAKRYDRYFKGDPKAVKEVRFNPGSNTQLAVLFVEKLGMSIQFRTDKGAPSFKSAMLGQWGHGGEMLKTRRKRLIVLKQAESLLRLSEVTGRFHPSLRTAGTKTGRYVGSN